MLLRRKRRQLKAELHREQTVVTRGGVTYQARLAGATAAGGAGGGAGGRGGGVADSIIRGGIKYQARLAEGGG